VNTYIGIQRLLQAYCLSLQTSFQVKRRRVLNVKLEDPTSIQLKQLNLGLYKFNLDRYLVLKVYIWVELLNERIIPIKWYFPSQEGTNVEIEFAHASDDLFIAKLQLKDYIKGFTKNHNIFLLTNF
jgi:hypothetical protein